MSDFPGPGSPPPPPPPWGGQSPGFGSAPPPPPPAYGAPPAAYGAPAYGQVPAGYVGYGQSSGPLEPPRGLRIATIVLLFVQSGLTLILGGVAFNRGEVAKGFEDGTKELSDIRDADNAVGAVAVFVILAAIATIVVLCLWAHHTVRNAKRRDPSLQVSPGMAAGGWFIPIGNFWLPWAQLRNSARRFGGSLGALGLWQGLTIAGSVLLFSGRGAGNFDDADDIGDLADKAHTQGTLFIIAGLLYVATAIVAMKATADVDRATSGAVN